MLNCRNVEVIRGCCAIVPSVVRINPFQQCVYCRELFSFSVDDDHVVEFVAYLAT